MAKIQTDRAMFRVLTGSQLYGTASENSDFDYQVIALPNVDDLLLNVKLTTKKVRPNGVGSQDAMLAGEDETTYTPIQIFMDDFFNGQTYALEIAFAVKAGLHESFDITGRSNGSAASKAVLHQDDQRFMTLLIDNFLTRNISKMMGYAIAQARLYGVKTERYKTVCDVIGILATGDITKSLLESPAILDKLLATDGDTGLVQRIKIKTGDGTDNDIDAIDVIGKQYPLTNKLNTIIKSLQIVRDSYGHRVKDSTDVGIEWKSLSHAIRIVEQINELRETGELVFPRPNAKYLRDIKLGLIPQEEALSYLMEIFSKAENDAQYSSKLKERTPELEAKFREFKLNYLSRWYQFNLQV